MMHRCAAAAPLKLRLYGDSIMRGLYFDLVEALLEEKQDRGWAKRYAGPGKGKRLETVRGRVQLSWSWWTLNESARLSTDWRLPPPPDLKDWGLDDPDVVAVFGSGAHNMRYGTVQQFREELKTLKARLAAEKPRMKGRAIWLTSAASHVVDDQLECVAGSDLPTHRMSWHRSQLFSAMGAEAMDGVVPLLDMWRLTADQGENCNKVHCDELYVPESDGFVSRAVANLMLNLACNERILPESELMKHLPEA